MLDTVKIDTDKFVNGFGVGHTRAHGLGNSEIHQIRVELGKLRRNGILIEISVKGIGAGVSQILPYN